MPQAKDRRTFLRLISAIAASLALPRIAGASPDAPVRLLLVHGRSQQGKDPDQLKQTWMETLTKGAERLGRSLPTSLEVAFPFYGDILDGFVRQYEIPLMADIQTKGSPVDDDFLDFQARFAEALRQGAGITDAQIDAEYGPNPKPKGPQNWEWVQAILQALDKHGGGMSASTLEILTRDVYLYTTRAGVRDAIDEVVAHELNDQPTVVVGHSLGSVVAYNVLRSDRRALRVPLYLTVGSPLGVRAIRDQLRPLRFPPPVTSWFNAFDDRDVVALYPLDTSNFPVSPAIENYRNVKNPTSNRHGIVGYLDDPEVARKILDSLDA